MTNHLNENERDRYCYSDELLQQKPTGRGLGEKSNDLNGTRDSTLIVKKRRDVRDERKIKTENRDHEKTKGDNN